MLLLHGFPDFWYGWRNQIPAFVEAGYHVVAPDLRGFGESDVPDSAEKYSELHQVGDIVGLLDSLQVKKVFAYNPILSLQWNQKDSRSPSSSTVSLCRSIT